MPVPVLSLVCEAGSGALDGVVSVLFTGILHAVTNTAVFVLSGLSHAMGSTTSVDLQAPWFSHNYRAMVAVATLVALLALVLAAFDSALRLDVSSLLRAAFFHLPVAALSVMVSIKVAALAMAGVDGLISTLERASGHPAVNLVKALSRLTVEMAGSSPGLFSVLLGLLVTFGTLVVWFELLLRSAAIAAVVLLFPLVMAAQIWPSLLRQAKRTVEILVALIVSKFVVAAVFLLGASAITGHAGVAGLLLGATLILLAAFAPFLVLRLLPLAEAVLATGLEGQRQRVTRLATTSARLAVKGAAAVSASNAAPLEQLVAQASRGRTAEPTPPPPAPTAATAEDLGGLVGVAPPPPRPPRAPIPGHGLPRIHHYLARDDFGPVIKFELEENHDE